MGKKKIDYGFGDNGCIRNIRNHPAAAFDDSISGKDGRNWLNVGLQNMPIGSGKAEILLEELSDYAYKNLQVGDRGPTFRLGSLMDPYLITDLPPSRLLGALKGIGAISETQMLDAYKSLDLGADNKFLQRNSQQAGRSWASTI